MPAYIELTQGYRAIVDEKFFDRLNQHKWCAQKIGRNYYATRNTPRVNGKKTVAYMHRMVLELAGVPLGPRTDHINRDGLDNRLENLRTATASQNSMNIGLLKNNTSGYRGVQFNKLRGKWSARLYFQNKLQCLGNYTSPIDAAHAYDAAARRLHGEFAHLNFPDATSS